ncbi:CopG family transcriptional regulator [Bradyrhizobium sp. SRL28]|uniref:CopG family transcriptional regulator n=1 Tax=Bradyrhizobium sp. SRL28 TaxID=2836178 RepID=UPI001BDE7529|nr:CopG family transcriptional regulator [Bradyrhizobium sp. SRL28]MBT1516222.1 CopG family transcriptional regulator [Bradyrhizobium sp. SRL28]
MKPKLSVYLSDHVAKRLTQAASRPGTNKSAIVDTALDRFLNPERDQSGDAALVRRLDRMSRQLDRMDRDLSITAETIALFVRYYLTITPPLPSGDQDAARALGRERFEMFVAQVGKRIASGGRLVADVMERVSASNPDLFLRNLEEGAPLGQPTAGDEANPRASSATGEPPEHSPEGREEVGIV